MTHGIASFEERVFADGATGRLTVDLLALARNYTKLCSLVAPARAAAVVKANAYGLGVERVVPTLYAKGCRHFFVAQFSEAAKLRPLLAIARNAQIFVLNGLQPGDEIACAENGIVPVINSLQQWQRWSAFAKLLKRRLPTVLQFDTGMSRLGIPAEECNALAAELSTQNNVEVLFIMSHLASADEVDNEQNNAQFVVMERIADQFPGFEICLANSAGIFLGKDYHGALTRPGIALYGGAPTAGKSNPMEPVVSLEVAVVQTRTVTVGSRVGYAGAYVAEKEIRLATIAAGYADGLPRSLSGRGAVYFMGTRLPITGRVSMDSITVDITALPEGTLSLGSFVEVLGPHQSLEDLASDASTVSYEILTSLGDRYNRLYR
ncbi:MAG: alanine racemase [Mesorhizobium sp.]|uniref:alanine racemase n=1 Tax=unclassified Mesorhizobium TaxID=325217 RepID=UPI000FE3EB86|nr:MULTISPECIES: alanine racemase [unclassified Mesorhizobium]RWI34129.1 MAG: alanine racemase [Mesorhizobium sp.]RWI63192.1 MAG: alanine racemase [Mesorhizobium sp.]RWI82493.1 MAG: alanine racemase [Mesorhizobium sp.]RWJ43925.1 MAG: alanine racemase [Mesorhizobium sp.]RWJ57432.1 MAG: alanine racemase [Mesorhizobium sp.]